MSREELGDMEGDTSKHPTTTRKALKKRARGGREGRGGEDSDPDLSFSFNYLSG